MSNYTELYYLKNKEEIIKKNVERQSKSDKYKEYQKQYYLKNKKQNKKELDENEKMIKEYYKKVERQEYYKAYHENKNDKMVKKTKPSLTLIL